MKKTTEKEETPDYDDIIVSAYFTYDYAGHRDKNEFKLYVTTTGKDYYNNEAPHNILSSCSVLYDVFDKYPETVKKRKEILIRNLFERKENAKHILVGVKPEFVRMRLVTYKSAPGPFGEREKAESAIVVKKTLINNLMVYINNQECTIALKLNANDAGKKDWSIIDYDTDPNSDRLTKYYDLDYRTNRGLESSFGSLSMTDCSLGRKEDPVIRIILFSHLTKANTVDLLSQLSGVMDDDKLAMLLMSDKLKS